MTWKSLQIYSLKKNIELPLPIDQLISLNPHAVNTRYEDIEIEPIDRQTVIEMIKKTRTWIKEQLYE
jgi:hypothetical protein